MGPARMDVVDETEALQRFFEGKNQHTFIYIIGHVNLCLIVMYIGTRLNKYKSRVIPE